MRIQVLSDLHLNWHPDAGKDFLKSLDPSLAGVDVLVLAGDLCPIRHESFGRMLRDICAKYPDVVFVPGNHEWEHADRDVLQARLRMIQETWCPNLHVLQEGAVTIKGQRFLGSTLWFEDTPLAKSTAAGWIDFRLMPTLNSWVWDASAQARNFLFDNVRKGDVVVTHHLPFRQSLDPRFAHVGTNQFYLNDMAEILGKGNDPSLWIHGHTHSHLDYDVGDMRVLANPFGSKIEFHSGASGFIENCLVDFPEVIG